MRTKTIELLLPLVALASLAGCDEDDRRLVEEARRAADRQAEQNSEMAQLNREVAEGTKRLVEADAEARKEMVVLQQEIQAERSSVSEGFDALETERKQLAQQRRTESLLIPTLEALSVATVAIVVVVFCLLLVHGARSKDSTDAELNELLIHDLASDEPQLIARTVETATREVPVSVAQQSTDPTLLTDLKASDDTGRDGRKQQP